MKRLFLLAALVMISCSKDDEEEPVTQADLIGTWQIYSVNGKTELDSCESQSNIRFTEDLIYMTGAYWGDTSAEQNCQVYTFESGYRVDGKMINIEYDGVSQVGYIIDENTIEVSTTIEGYTSEEIFKR